MDWNDHANPRPFIPQPATQSSFAFLFNYNDDHCVYPPGEMKHQMTQDPFAMIEMNQHEYENYNINQDKKKRLTSEQLEALENTFQGEKKLDPDTKMKLAHDLGLQPRQIAVWFQNRRARWKTKQLECLYDTLKQEFDAVCMEKHKLQEEVLALRSILEERIRKRQGAGSGIGYTYMSGEETVESTSTTTIPTTTNRPHQATLGQHHVVAATIDNSYMIDYDPTSSVPTAYSKWAVHQ